MFFKRIISMFLSLVLAASAYAPMAMAEENAETTQATEEKVPETRIITYKYKDGTVIMQTTVEAGGYPEKVPVRDKNGDYINLWLTVHGQFVSPSTVQIYYNTEFIAWEAPRVLKEKHEPYLTQGPAFRPNDALKRSEFCDMYSQIVYAPDNNVRESFKDVYSWSGSAITTIVNAGIISGYGDGTFRQNNAVTRGEFAHYIARGLRSDFKASGIRDISGHWAATEIEYAVISGWLDCYYDGTFRPDQPITRAEAVAAFNRLLGRSAALSKDRLISENAFPYYDVKSTDWFYADVMEATMIHSHTGNNQSAWSNYWYKAFTAPYEVVRFGNKGYCCDEKGQFVSTTPNSFVNIGGRLYRTTYDGYIDLSIAGLKEFGSDLYYFTPEHYALTNAYFDKLYFGADGRYTTGSTDLDRLVNNALASCTNSGMTQSEKLRASYLYLRDNCTYLSRAHHPRGVDYFVPESATFMFKNMRGNCYCYASCFLLMARRLGYHDAYIVSGGVGTKNDDHAWVMLGGKIFDPELEYAYKYRYKNKKDYNLYDMTIGYTPFIYHFPN